ncbi:hypothetical protein B0H14DRAFT_3637532 [Mycena olivaceomarginata]|nr:hypothetical protein B0H14DRAFT_3637532 [Mycena olivaceomarginata]
MLGGMGRRNYARGGRDGGIELGRTGSAALAGRDRDAAAVGPTPVDLTPTFAALVRGLNANAALDSTSRPRPWTRWRDSTRARLGGTSPPRSAAVESLASPRSCSPPSRQLAPRRQLQALLCQVRARLCSRSRLAPLPLPSANAPPTRRWRRQCCAGLDVPIAPARLLAPKDPLTRFHTRASSEGMSPPRMRCGGSRRSRLALATTRSPATEYKRIAPSGPAARRERRAPSGSSEHRDASRCRCARGAGRPRHRRAPGPVDSTAKPVTGRPRPDSSELGQPQLDARTSRARVLIRTTTRVQMPAGLARAPRHCASTTKCATAGGVLPQRRERWLPAPPSAAALSGLVPDELQLSAVLSWRRHLSTPTPGLARVGPAPTRCLHIDVLRPVRPLSHVDPTRARLRGHVTSEEAPRWNRRPASASALPGARAPVLDPDPAPALPLVSGSPRRLDARGANAALDLTSHLRPIAGAHTWSPLREDFPATRHLNLDASPRASHCAPVYGTRPAPAPLSHRAPAAPEPGASGPDHPTLRTTHIARALRTALVALHHYGSTLDACTHPARTLPRAAAIRSAFPVERETRKFAQEPRAPLLTSRDPRRCAAKRLTRTGVPSTRRVWMTLPPCATASLGVGGHRPHILSTTRELTSALGPEYLTSLLPGRALRLLDARRPRSRLPYRAPTSVLGTIRCPFTSRAAVFDASPAAPTPATGRPRPDSPERSQSQLLLPQGQEILHVQDLCHKHPFLLPPRPLTWCVFIATPNCRWPPAPPAAATFALARRVHGASTSRVRLARPVQWIPRVAGAASQRATPVSLSTYTAPSSARTLLRLRHRQSPHARKRLLSLSSPSAAPSPRCWIYCLSTAPAARSPRAPLLHRVRTAEEREFPARRRLSVEYAAAPTATTASLARASVLASPAPARIVRHSHSASAPFFDPAFRAVAAHVLRVATSTRGGHRPRLRRAYVHHGSRPAPTAPGVKAHGAFCSPAPHFNRTLRAASVRAELAHPSHSDTLALGRTTPDAVRALEGVLQCGSTVPAPLGARAVAITSRAAGRSDDPYLRPHRRPSPFDIGWATCARKHLLAPYWASTHVVHPV